MRAISLADKESTHCMYDSCFWPWSRLHVAVHSRSIVAYVVVRTYLSAMYVLNSPRTFVLGGGGGGTKSATVKTLVTVAVPTALYINPHLACK